MTGALSLGVFDALTNYVAFEKKGDVDPSPRRLSFAGRELHRGSGVFCVYFCSRAKDRKQVWSDEGLAAYAAKIQQAERDLAQIAEVGFSQLALLQGTPFPLRADEGDPPAWRILSPEAVEIVVAHRQAMPIEDRSSVTPRAATGTRSPA